MMLISQFGKISRIDTQIMHSAQGLRLLNLGNDDNSLALVRTD